MPRILLLAVVVGAVFVNGVVATIEDDAPGGFNNPDGATPPTMWPRWLTHSGRGLAALAGIVLGVWGVAAALGDDTLSGRVLSLGLAAAAVSLALAAAVKKRYFVWMSGGLVLIALIATAVLR